MFGYHHQGRCVGTLVTSSKTCLKIELQDTCQCTYIYIEQCIQYTVMIHDSFDSSFLTIPVLEDISILLDFHDLYEPLLFNAA